MQQLTNIKGKSVEASRLISFNRISDERGELTVLEGDWHLPFKVKRVFYVNNPRGERGNHAHKRLHELLIPMFGSLTVELDDGHIQKTFNLFPNGTGLLIPPMVWARQYNFSHNCNYLVLASMKYTESDYLHNYSEFVEMKRVG
jgi:hypothetical protein